MGVANFPVGQGKSGKKFKAITSDIRIPILYQPITDSLGRLRDALAGKF
jgi:hypothetical protein